MSLYQIKAEVYPHSCQGLILLSVVEYVKQKIQVFILTALCELQILKRKKQKNNNHAKDKMSDNLMFTES